MRSASGIVLLSLLGAASLAAVTALDDRDQGQEPGVSGAEASAGQPVTTATAPSTTTTLARPVDTPRTLVISPVSGPRGTRITVEGGGCPGSGIAAIRRDGDEIEGAQFGDTDASGWWRTELNIPDVADVQPDARYEVRAACYSGPGALAFVYESRPFDVVS